jgi:hypothetical protein
MQFIAISAFALATVAAALPATANENSAVVVNEKYAGEVIRISLPTGCSEKDLFSKSFLSATSSSELLLTEINHRVRFPLDRHHRVLRRCHH